MIFFRNMKAFSYFYTAKTTVQHGERRLVFMTAEQPHADSENNDDLGALTQRLELLQGKVDTQVLISQVGKATDHFWQKTNADQVINEYCTNPDSTKVQPLLDASRMTNNQPLADQLWGKGGAATLGESLKIFRMQFVGKIEDKIAEQVQNANETEKNAVRQNGSKLLEQLLAQESSAKESTTDSLFKSMRAVGALNYLKDSGIADRFQNKIERSKLVEEMQNGDSDVQLMPDGYLIDNDTWQWQQVHVLTGAGMMNINADLVGAFILKDVKVIDNGDSKVVIGRMQNGCQGNLFTAEIKKEPQTQSVTVERILPEEELTDETVIPYVEVPPGVTMGPSPLGSSDFKSHEEVSKDNDAVNLVDEYAKIITDWQQQLEASKTMMENAIRTEQSTWGARWDNFLGRPPSESLTQKNIILQNLDILLKSVEDTVQNTVWFYDLVPDQKEEKAPVVANDLLIYMERNNEYIKKAISAADEYKPNKEEISNIPMMP